MGAAPELLDFDRGELRELFDLRSPQHALTGGGYRGDPYPVWHRLRESGPVHAGVVHELTGWDRPTFFAGLPFPDRAHFSVFTFEACDEAFRDADTFASSPPEEPATPSRLQRSMLFLNGAEHRRYRALVQPSFVPARAKWWLERFTQRVVHALIDRLQGAGRADLNLEFCAQIPVLTITGAFGVPEAQALDVLRALFADMTEQDERLLRILEPLVAARRARPEEDLLSLLVEAETRDEAGRTQRLSDEELYAFAHLLLIAGSLTTWKQTGIALTALLQRPEWLAAVRADRALLRPAIEEATRWNATDPMFSRFVRRDIDFHGVRLPEGSVLHLCLGAANRDPARYPRPDEFDPGRSARPSLAFGSGPHVCLGIHLARAEMFTAIDALLERLPGLRLDPEAEPPEIIGMYHRGPTQLCVRFD